MSRLVRLFGTLLLVGAFGTGCQSLADYPIDRAMDIADIIGVNFYWGQGALANARATKLVQAGAGSFDGRIASYDKRAAGVAEEIRAEAGLPLYYFTTYDREATEPSNERFQTRIENETEHGVVKYNPTDPQDRSYYQIGADVAVFAGIGVNIDLLQLVDFTLGWFGLDIGDDDRRHEERPDVHGPRYELISELPVTKS